MNDKVVIARCLVQYWQIFSSFLIFCYYFTRLKAREISYNIWETQKRFPILHSAPCDNSYISYLPLKFFYASCKHILIYLRLALYICFMFLYIRYLWLYSISVKLNGDVEENSEPKPKSCQRFSICHCNVNSASAHNLS